MLGNGFRNLAIRNKAGSSPKSPWVRWASPPPRRLRTSLPNPLSSMLASESRGMTVAPKSCVRIPRAEHPGLTGPCGIAGCRPG